LIGKDWGAVREGFYNTEYVDPDWGSDSEAEREAEEEELEVNRLERQQIAEYNQHDFAFPIQSKKTKSPKNAAAADDDDDNDDDDDDEIVRPRPHVLLSIHSSLLSD
jgi:hypothetical protein